MRYLGLILLLLALAALSLAAGRVWLAPPALIEALSDPEGAGRMVWNLRLPRLLVGMIAGAGFGLSGLVFQTLLRNPLASPDVIGVTQVSAFGAVAALFFGAPVVLGAWGGGLAAIAALAWLAAHPRQGFDPRAVVLQGLALAIFAAAGTEALILRMGDSSAGMAMTWLSGTLNGAGWAEVQRGVWFAPLLLPLLLSGRVLDRLELGDDLARALGLRVGLLRAGLGLIAALVAAGSVALCGPMSFVALAAGPVGRLVAGGRPSPVAAMLTGAAFVTLADVLARAMAPAALLPTGLYTALIGAPVLILTVRRMAQS
ncbi:FecCD family ABC transporter permease [Paracoccus aestuariivivens]|uniref:Iron chelate uptake ABC transporter family permease subunit n=1 Tax=Paracoccus aestuariivivens TaxID=1820333 RepID=A0A6L6JH43_9RHOB|nr:iron ABC transporter permease [Paracoccus aestuariivivens]MTH79877.1 iron chelate uptake ABC transporter family permease subunit [Paracoccus aestuariivivens]